MGKNNRQRRRDKRRRAEPPGAGHGRAAPRESGAGHDERDTVEGLVFDASEAAEHGDAPGLDAALTSLASRSGPMVDMALTGCLVRALRGAWEGGWQPADIDRAARKRRGPAHARLAAEVMAVEARTSSGSGIDVPEPWAAQLRQVGVTFGGQLRCVDPERVRLGAGLLGMLTHLPVLPCLLPPPSQWGRGRPRPTSSPPPAAVDSRMLAKVRALLAKAESTDFEEEAAALTAKAQELMARHAIDQAMVEDSRTGQPPQGRRIGIDDPYAAGKARLLVSVAGANRCRTVWMDDYGFSTVFGFPGDLDIVDVLYTSLLVQATRAMTAAGSVRDEAGRSRTRSFRLSFLVSFAVRIGERLGAATARATDEAEAVHGDALLPVLAQRRAEVDDAVTAAFPRLRAMNTPVSNWNGWVAGRVAADLAHLGPEHQPLPGVAV
jgi:hypothetical protein